MSINIQEVTKISVDKKYPRFRIEQPPEDPIMKNALGNTITILEKGDLQLELVLNGQSKVIKNISPSAINVKWLLEVMPSIIYEKTEMMRCNITTVADYLEVV